MITLKLTNDDYYDSETDEFVMTVGASVTTLQTEVRIKDEDGEVWECYLRSLEFIPANKRGRRDVYIIRYRVY